MRFLAWPLLLCLAAPSDAQEPLLQNFRDSQFDRDLLSFSGQTPDKYITLEKEGLRLRYTGINAPPANNTAGVAWRFHARGDFIISAKYEILKLERPKKGWGVGAELYLRLKNANKDGVSFSRILPPEGDPKISFTYMTNGDDGRRVVKFPRQVPATDRSLRGAFRLARQGDMLTASFAEADDEFKEFQPLVNIGNADIDLIRLAGIAGGDPNAVLDLRMLEFNLQGKDLGYKGRDFATAAPKMAVPAAPVVGKEIAQPAAPVAPPAVAEPAPSGRRNLLLLAGVFFVLVAPLILIGFVAWFVRFRQRKTIENARTDEAVAAGRKSKKP